MNLYETPLWTPQTVAPSQYPFHSRTFHPAKLSPPGGIKELVNQLKPLVGWYLFLFLFELQALGRVQQLPPGENLQASNLPLWKIKKINYKKTIIRKIKDKKMIIKKIND